MSGAVHKKVICFANLALQLVRFGHEKVCSFVFLGYVSEFRGAVFSKHSCQFISRCLLMQTHHSSTRFSAKTTNMQIPLKRDQSFSNKDHPYEGQRDLQELMFRIMTVEFASAVPFIEAMDCTLSCVHCTRGQQGRWMPKHLVVHKSKLHQKRCQDLKLFQ